MNTKIKKIKRKDELKAVAFAYFDKNNFLGWYADTFGSISETPKVYRNTDSQIEIITKNFQHKLDRINESSFDVEKKKVKGLAALGLVVFDGEEILRGKDIELKIVELPYEHNRWLSLNKEETTIWAQRKPKKFLKTIKYKKPKKDK